MDAMFFTIVIAVLLYAAVMLGAADSRTFDDRGWWPGRR